MTTSYNALIELDRTAKGVPDETVDALLEELRDYAGVLGASPRGHLEVTITLPARDLRQAATSALAVVAGPAATMGAAALALEVMPTAEFDARAGMQPLPELLSTEDAASILGVSRQRVGQLVDAGQLQGERVGRGLVLPRAAVEAFAQRDRGPGRPRSSTTK